MQITYALKGLTWILRSWLHPLDTVTALVSVMPMYGAACWAGTTDQLLRPLKVSGICARSKLLLQAFWVARPVDGLHKLFMGVFVLRGPSTACTSSVVVTHCELLPRMHSETNTHLLLRTRHFPAPILPTFHARFAFAHTRTPRATTAACSALMYALDHSHLYFRFHFCLFDL